MNLVLIGYRGTGKTAIAELLAAKLGRERVGMDAELVSRFGTGVPEFVEANGWDAFRDAESELTRELSDRDNLVVDCGGGVIVRDENIENLRRNGRVVWLKAEIPTIVDRISDDDQRPSLTGTKTFVEEIEEVLAIRTPLYGKAAHHEIDTDNRTLEDLSDAILGWWKTETT